MSEKKYRVKPIYMVIPHGANRVEFRWGVWNPTSIFIQDHEEKGKLYSVVKLLDGEHSSKEIGKLSSLPTSQVEEVIDHLLQMNILEKAECSSLEGFLTHYMPIYSRGEQLSDQKPILLIGDEGLTLPLSDQLKAIFSPEKVHILDEENILFQELNSLKSEEWLYDGVSFLEKVSHYVDWKNFFVVLAFTNINPNLAKNFNRIAHELKISWLQVALDGPFILIGPTFFGAESPCYDCLESRIGMNLRENANYQKYKTALAERMIEGDEAKVNPLILSLIVSHAAVEIANAVATGTTFTMRKMLAIYLPTMEIAFNELFPLSSCQVCGAVPHQSDEQLYFDMQTQLGAKK